MLLKDPLAVLVQNRRRESSLMMIPFPLISLVLENS